MKGADCRYFDDVILGRYCRIGLCSDATRDDSRTAAGRLPTRRSSIRNLFPRWKRAFFRTMTS